MTGVGVPGVPPRPPVLVEDFDAFDAEIEATIACGRFARRTHEHATKVQNQFQTWCDEHTDGACALPAHPATLAAFLGWIASAATAPAMSTVQALRGGIDRAHRLAGHSGFGGRNGLVGQVMAGIAREGRCRRPAQRSPITADVLRRLVDVAAPMRSLTVCRDRAAVLVSTATGLTLREVAALPSTALRDDGTHVTVHGPDGTTWTLACACVAADDLLCPGAAVRELRSGLPASAGLAFGVVRATRGRDAELLFLGADDTCAVPRLIRAIQSALTASGASWPATRAFPHDPQTLTSALARRDRAVTLWLRDQATLLTAWHLALRGSEPGSLDMVDIERDECGWTVMLGRTKTDQVAAGTPLSLLPTKDPLLDPVAALDRWMRRRGPAPGPALSMAVPGSRGDSAPSASRISTLVRARAEQVGVRGSLSSHSLRIGWTVSAIRSGASIPDIMSVTRHRDPSMVGYYGRAELAARRAGTSLIHLASSRRTS